MKRKIYIVFAFGLMITGCAVGVTPIPNNESSAAVLYAEKCGTCHAVPHPKRNTAAEWQHLVALMEQRMAEKNMLAFSGEERDTLMNYLHNNAR